MLLDVPIRMNAAPCAALRKKNGPPRGGSGPPNVRVPLADDTIALGGAYSSVMSTRRFCALPAAVALVATGSLAPKPRVSNRFACKP
mgnify:CR=1 FL=1